jgi:hypothetical protein
MDVIEVQKDTIIYFGDLKTLRRFDYQFSNELKHVSREGGKSNYTVHECEVSIRKNSSTRAS